MATDVRDALFTAAGDTNVLPDLGNIRRRCIQLRRRRLITITAPTMAIAIAVVVGAVVALAGAHRTTNQITVRPASSPIASVASFPLPVPNEDLTGIVEGSDNNMWFSTTNSQLGRISPAGKMTFFQLPAGAGVNALTSGPDGNIWFADGRGKIGRVTVRSPNTITEFDLPASGTLRGNAAAVGITTGPDHNLWVTEDLPTTVALNGQVEFSTVGRIARVTTRGEITEFPIPVAVSAPTGITTGPDHNLWFNDSAARIGRITPAGHLTLFPLAPDGRSGAGGSGISAGPDRNLWFTEERGVIGRITPTGRISQYPVPGGGEPRGISVGPDRRLWFGLVSGQRLGRIDTNGLIQEYPLPPSSFGAAHPVPGPHSTLWTTDLTAVLRLSIRPG
jgi:virginiamycin B lyase